MHDLRDFECGVFNDSSRGDMIILTLRFKYGFHVQAFKMSIENLPKKKKKTPVCCNLLGGKLLLMKEFNGRKVTLLEAGRNITVAQIAHFTTEVDKSSSLNEPSGLQQQKNKPSLSGKNKKYNCLKSKK